MRHLLAPLTAAVIALTAIGSANAAEAAGKDDPWHFKGLPRCVVGAALSEPCQSALSMTAREKAKVPDGLSASAHGDALDVTYRGSKGPFAFGEAPYLGGDLQTFLEGGEGGLWSARIRVPDLDRAVLDVSVVNTSPPLRPVTFQGEHADHAAVDSGRAAGKAQRETLHSQAMADDRDIYVFRGRHCINSGTGCILVILADGDILNIFLNSGPSSGEELLDNFILVGIAPPSAQDGGERRIAELLLDAGQPEFQRFEAFVLDEVIPHVEGGTSARWVGGYSNGGAWAVDMALRHPKVFKGALGFSIASFTKDWKAPKQVPVPRPTFLLGGGSLESAGFGRRIRLIATGLSALGLSVEERQFTGGHSRSTWNALFWSYLPEVAKQTGSS